MNLMNYSMCDDYDKDDYNNDDYSYLLWVLLLLMLVDILVGFVENYLNISFALLIDFISC